MWIQFLDTYKSHAFCSRLFIGIRPFSEMQLVTLYNEYGASPLSLANYGADPEAYEATVKRKVNQVGFNELQLIFFHTDKTPNSPYLTITEPSPTDRMVPTKRVISKHVFELLWVEHLKTQVSEMQKFYDLFRASEVTAISAGCAFEIRMHQLLKMPQTIRLYPIGQTTGTKNFIYTTYQKKHPVDILLPGLSEHTLVHGDNFYPNRYYRPRSTNYPTVDSLILIPPPT